MIQRRTPPHHPPTTTTTNHLSSERLTHGCCSLRAYLLYSVHVPVLRMQRALVAAPPRSWRRRYWGRGHLHISHARANAASMSPSRIHDSLMSPVKAAPTLEPPIPVGAGPIVPGTASNGAPRTLDVCKVGIS